MSGVDKSELLQILSQYLTESEREAIVYHYTGDQPLYLTLPETITPEVMKEYKQKRSYHKIIEITELFFNVHEQKVEIRFTFHPVKYIDAEGNEYNYQKEGCSPIVKETVENSWDRISLKDLKEYL